MNLQLLHFEVPFASLLAYSPRGNADTSVESRKYRDAIKKVVPGFCDKAADEICKFAITDGEFQAFFGPKVTVVPAPKSSIFYEGALWPGRELCNSLLKKELCSSISFCVRRDITVPKSAYAAPGERPDFQKHLETCSFVDELSISDNITIVDDIITRGTSLAAFAAIVARHRPKAHVRVFALIRTMGLQPEVDKILLPCVGRIKIIEGKVNREP